MKQSGNLFSELCEDDVVCFLAERHHVTPERLLHGFLAGEASLLLEPNEVEILNGLSRRVGENRIADRKRRQS